MTIVADYCGICFSHVYVLGGSLNEISFLDIDLVTVVIICVMPVIQLLSKLISLVTTEYKTARKYTSIANILRLP